MKIIIFQVSSYDKERERNIYSFLSHLKVNLPNIAFILTYLKEHTSDKSDQLIQSILQTNDTLRNKIEAYLNRKANNLTILEFPFVHNILFRSYHAYLLHNINRQQFLSRTLIHRKDHTSDYFTTWFECFLCQTTEDWLNYKELTRQWTECFIRNRKLISEIMEKIDLLIDLWIKAEPNNTDRLNFFVTHMVTQCFQHGKKERSR